MQLKGPLNRYISDTGFLEGGLRTSWEHPEAGPEAGPETDS